MKTSTRSRAYVYTLNNFTFEETLYYQAIPCKFHVYGEEKGEKGTPHLQGYIYFENARYFNSVCKLLKRAHVAVARGDAQQNVDYCLKQGGKNFVNGDIPSKGKRSDIEFVKKALADGRPIKYIVDNTDSLQALKYAESAIKYTEIVRDFMPKVYWFYGPTGSGKSREAASMCPEAYYTTDTNQWWDGYDAHSEVIIDDFRADFCKFHVLLKLLDRYPFRVAVKGGFRQFLAKTIIITTPHHPTETFKTREDIDQLLRRIFLIKQFFSPMKCQENITEDVDHTKSIQENPTTQDG